jgi:hypothetical protein
MATLEQEIERLEDVRAIKNVMGSYLQYEMQGKHDLIENLFALKSPGVRAEISELGIWEGADGIRRLIKAIKKHEGDRIGVLNAHPTASPVIEVAEDGKTAKGLWLSLPGYETFMVDGKPKAYLSGCKYGIDFIREDGQWKFWHFHIYYIYRYPSEKGKSWIDNDFDKVPAMDVSGELRPDKKPSVSAAYSANAVQGLVPAPPRPYRTFDEKTAY